MKKIVLSLFLFLSLPVFAFATTGSCSDHNGVNCSAGSDYDGSVICNDGWRDSATNYYDATECTSVKHYCTQSEYNELYNSSRIPSIKEQVITTGKELDTTILQLQSINAQLQSITDEATRQNLLLEDPKNRAGDVTASYLNKQQQENNRQAAIKALPLQSQILEKQASIKYAQASIKYAQNEYKSELNRIMTVCLTKGEDNYRQREYNDWTEKMNALKKDTIEIIENKALLDSDCQYKIGNSYAKENACYCNSGYEMNENKNLCIKSTSTNGMNREQLLALLKDLIKKLVAQGKLKL